MSTADAQAPRHGVIETVWLLCDEAQQVGCLRGQEIVRWCSTQASGHSSQGVVYGGVNEAGASTAAPDMSVVQYFAVEWTRANVVVRRVFVPTSHPGPENRLKSGERDVNFLRSDWRCRLYVSACPTLLRGMWARSKKAGFRCCS